MNENQDQLQTSANTAKLLCRCLAVMTLIGQLAQAASPSTAFTYQGKLFIGDVPANGLYDLQFTNYDAIAGGNSLGAFNTNALPVTNGLFTVTLDFGAVFDGTPRWLEISECTNGLGTFATLAPRQLLAAAPYATYAASAGAVAGQVIGSAPVAATVNNTYIATNDAQSVGLTLPANATVGQVVRIIGLGGGGWSVTTTGGQVLKGGVAGAVWTPCGTEHNWVSIASSADGTKLVAGAVGDQIYTSSDSGVTWTPRDSNRNWRSVASSADGVKLVAVVYGGQIYTSSDSGVTWTPRDSNRNWNSVASSADGTKLVAGDGGNWPQFGQIYTSSDSGVTWTPRDSLGVWTSVASSADGTKLAAAAPGDRIYTSSDSGVTWTRRDNSPRSATSLYVASSADGTKLVAANYGGQIYTSSDSGVTWTPRDSNRNWSSVTSSADGVKLVAVVYGGQIYTSSDTGAGGVQGASAEFMYAGNGVWQPAVALPIATDNIPNTTVARDATGNISIAGLTVDGPVYTDSAGQNTGALIPGLIFGSTGSGEGISSKRTSGIDQYGLDFYTQGNIRMTVNNNGNVGIGTSTPAYALDVSGDINASGSVRAMGVALSSDRNAKENFTAVNAQQVLAKVAALPMSQWNFKTDSHDVRHLGPMAQDFQAAFGLDGADDKHISVVDEGGVALAAIQGLNQKLEETRADNAALRADNADLKARLEKLERLLQPSK